MYCSLKQILDEEGIDCESVVDFLQTQIAQEAESLQILKGVLDPKEYVSRHIRLNHVQMFYLKMIDADLERSSL